ncbi:hypothetical protein [Paenibacillus sp. OK060]|uniref:hypothetical protein n=1 Tax=Paenibacillus sp. OK060 TaxID=1881034 RepID=UPI0015A0A924|nr:hypothetical protein [Paenibacillus sp. OK060]
MKITESGLWTYQVRTTDFAGNIGESAQVVVKIDKIAPTEPKLSLSNNELPRFRRQMG